MKYPDIYFHPGYASAHESIENGKAVQFVHRSGYGTVSHTFIKRKIDIIDNTESAYFDIITPYGYGGPIVLECPNGDYSGLLGEFMFEFSDYCKCNRIVSEFVRFHPLESNHLYLDGYYEIIPIKKTLGTNLVDLGDPFISEFSKKCRKKIEKCIALGMTFQVGVTEEFLNSFMNIYASTMNRHHALEYYYFDKAYFRDLLRIFPENAFIAMVFLNHEPIAAGLFLHFGRYVHVHLSGTSAAHIQLSPAYLLRSEVVRWSWERGYKFVHHGGGYTNSQGDGLFQFKKSFAQNTEFDFHVGKRIWDESAYEAFMRTREDSEDKGQNFFPAYRRRS